MRTPSQERAASGGALAPEPLHATRNQLEPAYTDSLKKNFFSQFVFDFFQQIFVLIQSFEPSKPKFYFLLPL